MNKKIIYGIWAVLVIAYVSSVFIIQPDLVTMKHYNLTSLQIRLLSLTVVIPIFAFWFAAIYGMVKVGSYYSKIKDTAEGKGFKYLAYGLAVFGFGQAITSVTSRLMSYFVTSHNIPYSTMTIINTHLTIVVQMISFGFFLAGAYYLVNTLKKVKYSLFRSFGTAFILAVVSALYSVSTLANPGRSVGHGGFPATYAMPDWLILTTIVLPYILVWALGFYTALFLRTYYKNVRGALYKKSLARITIGFFAVILSSIALQFATAAIQAILGWGLNGLLSVLYVLIIIMAVGYIYIAIGAKNLAKLEEVV